MTVPPPSAALLAAVRGCCIATTLSVIFSGVPSAVRMVQQRTTGGKPITPYVFMMLDNLLGAWLSHTSGDLLGLRFRALSIAMTTLYLAVFVAFAPPEQRRASLNAVIALVASAGALFGGIVTIVPPSSWRHVLGLAVTCSAVAFASSPLADVRRFLKARDASAIPLPLMAAVTACSSSWAVYGALRRDAWMVLPNVLNAVLGAVQVGLALALPGPGDAGAATRVTAVVAPPVHPAAGPPQQDKKRE